MAEIVKGMLVGGKDEVLRKFVEEIRPLVDITQWVQEPSLTLGALRNAPPRAVFLDLGDDPVTGLNLAHRMVKTAPETLVFTLYSSKAPDLILEAFRMGVADFLVWPASPGEALAAVRRALEKTAEKRRKGEVCSVFSMKGGQGVTSIALNLADHIQALSGERVLLLDLNLYASDMGARLNLAPQYTPFDLQKDIKRVDHDLLFSSLLKHERGFYVLACSDDISDADRITGDDVAKMLEVLTAHLDFIVADLPHDFSPRTLAALDASDQILLVFQQDISVIQSTLKVLQFFRELGYAKDKVRLILNRSTRNGDLSTEDLVRVFQQPVFAALSNDYKVLLQCINEGRPVDMIHGESPFCKNVRELAGRLTGISPAEPPRSFWRRVLTRCAPGLLS